MEADHENEIRRLIKRFQNEYNLMWFKHLEPMRNNEIEQFFGRPKEAMEQEEL